MCGLEPLQHESARATAIALTNVIIAVLRPEEVQECRREFYKVLRASLQAYEELRGRDVPESSVN